MVGEPAVRTSDHPTIRQRLSRCRAGLRFLAAGSGYTDDADTTLTGSEPTPTGSTTSPGPSRTRLRFAGLAVLALALLLPAVPAWAAPTVSFELTSGNAGSNNTIASANEKSEIRIIFDTESGGTDRYAYNLNCGVSFEYAGAPFTALKNILTLKKNTSTGPDIGFTVAHETIVKESGRWKDKFVITPSADLEGGASVYVAITNSWSSYPGDGYTCTRGSAANATYEVKTKPPKPTLAATGGDRQVRLQVTNASNGGEAITKWKYRYKAGSGSYGSWTVLSGSAGNSLDRTIGALRNASAYTFQVRAVNSLGDGTASDEKSATPAGPPRKPSNFTVTRGNGQVTLAAALTRRGKPFDNGSAITRWEYRYKSSGNYGNWTAITSTSTSIAGKAVTGLTNGTAYTFQVRAVNGAGNGASSNEVVETPRAPSGTIPAPTILRVYEGGNDGELHVAWKWDHGGTYCQVTGYTVQYKETDVYPITTHWGPNEGSQGNQNQITGGVFNVSKSWGDATSISRETFVIGPGAYGGNQHEFGVGLQANISFDARVRVKSSGTCGNSGYSSALSSIARSTNDIAAPTVSSATVNGNTLTVTFNEYMKATSKPDASRFTVGLNSGTAPAVRSYTLHQDQAVLTLSSEPAIYAGDTVTLSYAKPTGANATVLEDLQGNDLANVTNQVVTNSTPAVLVLNKSALVVNEGATATFTVKLAANPSQDVKVSISRIGAAPASLSTNKLTFTPQNGTTAQTVTVTGVLDADDKNEAATVRLIAFEGSFDGRRVDVRSLPLTVTDTSGREAIDVSATRLEIAEGSSGEISVKLAKQPAGDVRVRVARNETADGLSVSPAVLTFTSGNYNTAQSFTFHADQDQDTDDERFLVSLEASGGGYDARSGGSSNVRSELLSIETIDNVAANMLYVDDLVNASVWF